MPDDRGLGGFKTKTRYHDLIPIIFIIGASTIVFLVFATPLLSYLGYTTIAGVLYSHFSTACHQLPERSIHILGYKTAVCARCTGVYVGLLAGSVGYFLFGVMGLRVWDYRITLLLTLPLVADGLGHYASLWESGNVVRLATGVLFGCALSFYGVEAAKKLAGKALSLLE